MDNERRSRYRDKINFITRMMELVVEKPSTELEKMGIFYSCQTAIEAGMDLIAMGLKDTGVEVSDDYSNIEHFSDSLSLKNSLRERLKKINGFRNALVHR